MLAYQRPVSLDNMDPTQMDAWMVHNQNQFYPNQYHGISTHHEVPSDIPTTPSLSGSPVLSDHDNAALSQMYMQAYGRNSFSEDTKVNCTYPMTPSDLGSQDDMQPHPRYGHQHSVSLDMSTYSNMASPISSQFPPAAIPYTLNGTPGILTSPIVLSRASSTKSPRNPATSGRRRAQNRAAQRAFRERKEKHARDLEVALAALTQRYQSLESSHAELSSAYQQLRGVAAEVLAKEDDDFVDEEGGSEAGADLDEGRKGYSKEKLRQLLEVVHDQMVGRGVGIKNEDDG